MLYDISVGKSFFYNQSNLRLVILIIKHTQNEHKCIVSGCYMYI